MILKEKLGTLKKKLSHSSLSVNRDYEFETELEDHPLGNQNVYRLRYINYHRIGERFARGDDNVGVFDLLFKPFMLPQGMKRNDAFKVLSYLTDNIERQLCLEPCSQDSVLELNRLLDAEKLGFTRLNIKFPVNDTDIIDLFTVTGRLLLFKQSDIYSKYFEWYTESVTLEEIQGIYSKCGIDFDEEVVANLKEEQGYSRILGTKKY